MNIQDFFNSQNNKMRTTTSSLSNLYTPPEEPVRVSYNLKDREATVTDEDIQNLRPLIYGEISNRDYSKKQLEADVITNTALNRQREYARKGQKKTISDVLSMPNQYQAYQGQQYNNYFNPVLPGDIAKKREVDMIVDAIADKIKRGEYVDNTEGAYYYIHEKDGKIKYDNLKKLFAD